LFEVENTEGKRFLELDKVSGFDQWMGLLREIKATGTLRGKLVFDVEPASYRLRVTDAGDGEDERVRLIQIPFRAGIGQPPK
jgi:hypothetical protein